MELDDLMNARHVHLSDSWEAPTVFAGAVRDDQIALTKLLQDRPDIAVVDPVRHIADDLFEFRNPDKIDNTAARRKFLDAAIHDGSEWGTWVYFPWKRAIVRFPNPDDHWGLRTFRNRNLITASESEVLRAATVAVFGLSVGSNIVDQCVQTGIGEKIVMGDTDTVSPTNLNRIRAAMSDVGLPKVVVQARKVSESNPFVEQVHLERGYTPSSDTVLDEHRPDVIVDEVDDVVSKARIRRYAQSRGIPVVMVADLADKAVIDVERHDQGNVTPFLGRLSQQEFEMLCEGGGTEKERRQALVKIVGARHISPKMLASVMQIGTSLAGFPQLGSAATAGGALASVVIREIILDRKMRSGHYVFSPKRILDLQRDMSIPATAATMWNFRTYVRR
ncbi:hypothetical protein GCM10011410_19160 [Hoyosella rhizosphaerae]|uniref:THIF-type NAD/FAD binding fold domain-containing protein n=1 Tax=Hoyosella rhizosphaerae TaxID=1755582 RepID=A0A916XET5_9ACTN|nr:hypothetical protein GCM10011410_19160 [Hoyosella rhizosphaerae]